MNIVGLFNLLFFLVQVGIMLAKIYNIMDVGKFLNMKMVFILLILSSIAFLANYISFSLAFNETREVLLYRAFIYRISTFIYMANVLFTIIELFIRLSKHMIKTGKKLKIKK